MPVFKSEAVNNFTTIPNYTLQDKSISAEAKGVLVLMLSMPSDWAMYKSWLIDQCPGCGRDKMGRILKELEHAGYLHREQTKDKANGKFDELTWWIFPLPQPPGDWKPVDGSPVNGKSAPTKETDIQKKHNTNTCQSVGSTPPLIDEPELKPDRLDSRDNARALAELWNQVIDEHSPNWRKVSTPEVLSAKRERTAKQAINFAKARYKLKHNGTVPTWADLLDWFTRYLEAAAHHEFHSGYHVSAQYPQGFRRDFDLQLKQSTMEKFVDENNEG